MNFLLHLIIVSAVTMMPALGYNVVFGRGKILYFGQIVFSVTASYTVWVLITQYQWSFFTAAVAAVVIVTALALFFTELSLRLAPDGFGVLSIAMHLMALAIVLNWQSVTRGALGISNIPRGFFPPSSLGFAILVVVLAALWIWILWWIDRGPTGRALAALAEHQWHASALGVSRRKINTIAFLLSGAGSILSGILAPTYLLYLTHGNYDFPAFIFLLTCVVTGGPGRVLGVAIATVSLVFLREGLRFLELPPDLVGPSRLLLFGLILFAAVWWRRDTLFPAQRTV